MRMKKLTKMNDQSPIYKHICTSSEHVQSQQTLNFEKENAQ